MGIQGLLQALKPVTKNQHISTFAGKRVGVDTYAWLHKGCFSCAYELAVGIPTTKYIQYIMNRVTMLLNAGVTPVLVFDGADIPLKGITNDERKLKRENSHAKAKELLSGGHEMKAREEYAKAFDITPELAATVAEVFRSRGVDCIVAPYEADAQLAYLAHTGYIDAVITEDSDLVAHGVPYVITKLDPAGNGEVVSFDAIPEAGFPSTSDRLQHLMACILAGCDYLKSLRGIGIKKAVKLVTEFKEFSAIIGVLGTSTKFGPYPAEELQSYSNGFEKALYAFRHHWVVDPITKKMVNLNPLGDGEEPRYEVLGTMWSHDVMAAVCEGKLCPISHAPYQGTYSSNVDIFRQTKHGRETRPLTVNTIAGPVKQPTLKDMFKGLVVQKRVREKQPSTPPRSSTRPLPETPPSQHPTLTAPSPPPVKKRRVIIRSRFFKDVGPRRVVRRVPTITEEDAERAEMLAAHFADDSRESIPAAIGSDEYSDIDDDEDDETGDVCLDNLSYFGSLQSSDSDDGSGGEEESSEDEEESLAEPAEAEEEERPETAAPMACARSAPETKKAANPFTMFAFRRPA